MSEREDRMNVLRKARGKKPLPPVVDEIVEAVKVVEEKSPFEEALEIEIAKPKKKKTTKKKEVIVETKEEVNTDSLFEAKPLNKKEEKIEEELLNE